MSIRVECKLSCFGACETDANPYHRAASVAQAAPIQPFQELAERDQRSTQVTRLQGQHGDVNADQDFSSLRLKSRAEPSNDAEVIATDWIIKRGENLAGVVTNIEHVGDEVARNIEPVNLDRVRDSERALADTNRVDAERLQTSKPRPGWENFKKGSKRTGKLVVKAGKLIWLPVKTVGKSMMWVIDKAAPGQSPHFIRQARLEREELERAHAGQARSRPLPNHAVNGADLGAELYNIGD